MKSRLFALFAFMLVLALALPPALFADDAAPPARAVPATASHPSGAADRLATPPTEEWQADKPFVLPRPLASPAGADAPEISLGQPGTSFRYVKTFGVTETAYLEDNNHFYDAEGIATDGANLWVTDSWGTRVVKFDNSGGFLQKIGKPGFRDSSGASLDYVSDVAVDAGGNIWVVDGGANHVVKYDPAGARVSELGQTWSAGSDNAHFDSPISIAFDAAGNIYVSDSGLWGDYGNQRVQVFDSSGNYRATIGQTGVAGADNSHFRRPRHLAVYGSQLYVADAGNQRVQIFDIANPSAPSYVATLGITGASGNDNSHFDGPEGVGADASYIYVADSNNQRVQIFSRTTRTYVATIGTGSYGTDNNHFNHPTDVAIDAAGNIYVADNWNKRVQQYNAARVYQRTYGTTQVSYATDAYHYYFPIGVAVGKDGSTYIVENHGHRLVKLDANGAAQWTVGQPGQGICGADGLNWPQDAAVDPQGRVYVVQNGCSDWSVLLFNADGAFYAKLGTGWGTGNDQFENPRGLAVDQSGNILVADTDNQRVQIFGPNRAYIATLGQTGVAGSDNSHFNTPSDVAVDGNGTIYVADEGNDRVQVFNSGRQYVRTIGGGGTGSDFGHFNGWGPNRLAVDGQNRLYVADSGNNRVQVFDAAGAYVTTIGGSWGPQSGQMRGPHGLAIGPDGALYVADQDNDRVQKFALGVPGWKQVNINGWGDRNIQWLAALAPFGSNLYAGANSQLWRMSAAGVWTLVRGDGFGDADNWIDDLYEFGGQLYVGLGHQVCDDPNCNTWHSNGGQIWRSSDGAAWSQVMAGGFGDTTNGEVQVFAAFGGLLYAATWSDSEAHGTEIWRSATGAPDSWSRVVDNGFGDAHNFAVLALAEHNGYLYASTGNGVTGGEVWRSPNGVDWTQVNTDGFGEVQNSNVSALGGFNDALYAGTYNGTTGGQVWRCTVCDGSDWTRVVADGFGSSENRRVSGLLPFNTALYAIASNYGGDGLVVRRTTDGVNWVSAAALGFGDSNNTAYWENAFAVHNNRLYIGASNRANGAEVWVKSLTADFTATPARGRPPLAVQFTNTSAGDYTSSLWDFGDGATSTETNPSHTYARAGKYTVKLTVGDGTDSDTASRAAVTVGFSTWLPVIDRNHDPLLYDDFNDPQWDGAWNPGKWEQNWDPALFRVVQQDGALTFSNLTSTNKLATLEMLKWRNRGLGQLEVFEARVQLSSNRTGGGSTIWIHFGGPAAGHTDWYTECGLDGEPTTSTAYASCQIAHGTGSSWTDEFNTPHVAVAYDTWHVLRMEADPMTGTLRFYLDGASIGSHTPKDAVALLSTQNLSARLAALNFSPNSMSNRYVDWVRITPAK